MPHRTFLHCLFEILLAASLVLAWPLGAQAQFGIPGSGWPLPRPVDQYSTNQIDLDRDGATDFEIVTHRHIDYWEGPFGPLPADSWQVSLIPIGPSQILAADSRDPIQGDVLVLKEGELVGPTTPGRHWSSATHTLVYQIEQASFLVGPLSSVWIFRPGYHYIGVRFGPTDSAKNGWLCFHADRGMAPMFWGYARTPGAPATVGDRSTAPPLTLQATLRPGTSLQPATVVLSWEPNFSEVTLEERNGLHGSWKPIVDPANPKFRFPNFSVTVDRKGPASEPRFFRIELRNP